MKLVSIHFVSHLKTHKLYLFLIEYTKIYLSSNKCLVTFIDNYYG